MGFLDNSGDIILDAVLTDTGRFRLAKGNGSFKIAKFAFGDDEINYGLYEINHLSGSAYYDLKILQTPILEAFTNNGSIMNSKLVSIPKTNLLFMPVMKLNTNVQPVNSTYGMFLVAATTTSEITLTEDSASEATFGQTAKNGILRGVTPGATAAGATAGTAIDRYIQIDQGLDTDKISQTFSIDPDLRENQYIVQIDNRLGRIVTTNGTAAPVSFIDDDNIATYYFSSATEYVGLLGTTAGGVTLNAATGTYTNAILLGPMGTYLKFKVAVSVSLNTSNYLFDTLGAGTSITLNSKTFKFIDTNIKVTGASTGYSVSIPVRFVKQID